MACHEKGPLKNPRVFAKEGYSLESRTWILRGLFADYLQFDFLHFRPSGIHAWLEPHTDFLSVRPNSLRGKAVKVPVWPPRREGKKVQGLNVSGYPYLNVHT